ncbi:uncharacterized protein LOC144135184 [Amblyomma americanum]
MQVMPVPYTMCRVNVNDMVPCTVSPYAPMCPQMRGTCCRGSCVCTSYPNPCIMGSRAAVEPAYLGFRAKRDAHHDEKTGVKQCLQNCRNVCKAPSCQKNQNRKTCKSKCMHRCRSECRILYHH